MIPRQGTTNSSSVVPIIYKYVYFFEVCRIIEKRRRGRTRMAFCDQIKERVKVSGYREAKELAMDREAWRRFHLQEHDC